MYVLFIILNEVDYLDDILTIFCDLGVSGATILDSQGMASAIVQREMDSIPLFGSLKTLLKGSRPYNKTIFTVIQNEELLNKTVSEIRKKLSKTKNSPGMMFTVPLGKVYSLK